MIKTYSLTKEYGGEKVLNLSELEIPKGELFGLIGNNGAGKTTFFSLLLDLIEATSGTVEINNIMVHQSEAWKPFISAFIDESYLIGYLTVEEYFYFLGSLRGKTQVEVDSWIKAYEPFFNGEILNQKKYLRDFSKGNQKKVGIVGALIGQPEVIVLDEPFANLDPTTQIRLKSLIKEEAMNNGTTFLISSHDLTHVTEVCDRIVLLDKGTVLKDIKKTSSTLKELEQYFSN
ncbi:ABC transporter ATP-binding protein [Flavobacteriaceae bacterium]|mgnify:FL=1|jgi:ABC-2 type transport system ATP-binding protein|nr:ABC transporter ATP-binding protein [Flavobacteriaceae bacterium]MDA8849180.1 ABC transporter ATP-binding protein [Flavobacteriaceae bacterium]MDB4063268.1 ABC transporter ATP-binding protein [Flavobacteriaceae bacterium]MDC0001113.1 ABC transporter ATP-binding protein [Flavobacteriaceae bacterium]